jgi:hypothetical protein
MDPSDDDVQQHADADRREVDPPIVLTAGKGGSELLIFVREIPLQPEVVDG